MKFKPPVNFTYKGHLQNVHYDPGEMDEHLVQRKLESFTKLASLEIASSVPPVFYIINYCQSSYQLLTGSIKIITGYEPCEFMEAGIPLLMHIYNPDDFKVYNEKIFTANSLLLKTAKQSDHERLIFTYNFRVKGKDGKQIVILQQGTYITCPKTGQPLYSIGVATDITHFKTDTVMIHKIDKLQSINGVIKNECIAVSFFYPNEEEQQLTGQEKKLLQYMADGLSTKMIADKLKISENTISNHRKNMMRKTNTHNVAHLIAVAVKNRII